MNNNRNTNRRRGRGNRQQGGGGGNQMNRIDSRARGNAPQMLDKYKKLAQDAQHNGDRVQAEYYLQFADHYFRVINDNKARQDEQRGKRDDRERDANNDDDGDEDDFDDRRQQGQRGNRGPRNRPRRDDNREDNRDDGRERADEGRASEGSEGSEYEPAENPFVRSRDREDAPRRSRKRPNNEDSDRGEIDAAALPPSISEGESAGDGSKPKRKPAARRRKDGDEGGTLKAVG